MPPRLPPPVPNPCPSASAITELRLSDTVTLDVLERDGEFLGIGEVRFEGVPLRGATPPMLPDIRTPSGVQLVRPRLVRTVVQPEGIRLELAWQRRDTATMDWMLHAVRPVRPVGDWSQPERPAPETSLTLELRPVERRCGASSLRGFSYRYRYRSASLPIHCILDQGSWEPGGHAAGNTLLLRNAFSPSVRTFGGADDFFSTEWYLPSAANPQVFQFLPFQTELSGFTFTSGPVGTLISWATEVEHIRTLIEKPRGLDRALHLHEHCGDLAPAFDTAPMEVLLLPGALNEVERFNLHEDFRVLVAEHLHAQLGMRREFLTTYGMIEEWTRADLRRYAREALPPLLDAGVRKVALANLFQNNMNVWGVSNMCCTVDYRMPCPEDEAALKDLCEGAHAAGAKVEMWANTALSTLTEIFSRRNGTSERLTPLPAEGSVTEVLARASAPFVRNPSHAIEADHYTPVFAVLNLRDEDIRAYWLERWGAARAAIGLDGIFLDSSFNLSSDKFHWIRNPDVGDGSGGTADQTHLLGEVRPTRLPAGMILSQYRAHLDLMVEMQRLGYAYNNEDLGVFGVHRHGPGVAQRLDSLPLWSDCVAWFDRAALRKADADPDDVYFRGLAYRMVWGLAWDLKKRRLSLRQEGLRDDDDAPTARELDLLRLYAVVESSMRGRRCVLPGERGVVYRNGRQGVLWSFEPLRFDFDAPVPVRDLTGDQTETTSCLAALGGHVYRFGP